MTNNKHKIFNLTLMLLPFIDLLTSLTARFTNFPISLGTIVKSLLMLYFIIYILFLTNSKKKKTITIYLFSMLLYAFLYFISKPQLISEGFLIKELTYLIKILFLPIFFSGLICYFEDSGFNTKKMNMMMLINGFIYITLFILPIITNTSFNTYIDGSKGTIGWFYAGNEISAILVAILPFTYSLLQKNKPLFLLILIIQIFTFSLIGTKVVLFGSIIVAVLILIETILESKKIKSILISGLALTIVITIMLNSNSVKNMNKLVETPLPPDIPIEAPIKSNPYLDTIIKLLSSREIYIIATNNLYVKNVDYTTVLLGLGFSNTKDLENVAIEKLIEIDLLDLFYHTGIIGLSIVLLPFFYCLIYFIKAINRKKAKIENSYLFYGFMILLICGVSCMSGHVLLCPAVSIYLAIYLIYFLNSLGYFKKSPLKKDKVQILSLHLGYGGAERATIDLANMLSKKFDVELISLYKTVDTPPYEISSNIKITYLTELKPNKKEFLNNLKKKKIIKTIREGLKSIKILFLKHHLIERVSEYSDAEFIISSRIYFTKILNDRCRKNIKIISIEHNYNIDDDYIKAIDNSKENVTLLVCVSKSASKIYKEKISNLNIKYIPNMISADYQKTSKFNNDNLIYAGRLEPEKGTLDLISIIEKLKSSRPHIKLNIYGEGSLEEDMNRLIVEKNLTENIILNGFKNPKELELAYSKSSLFILPSYKESFGIVLIEAMKCGIPALAFEEATGARELITDNQNGYIIKNRNFDEAAEKIDKFLNLPKEKKMLFQKKAIETANRFTEDKISQKWYETLKELK